MRPSFVRRVAVLTLLALVGVGCGSGDDDANSTDAEGSASASNSTTAEPVPGATDEHYPVTITHAFGEATIPTEPMRVVTVLRGEHDFAIALGVTPTAQLADAQTVDGFYYPWTEAALDGATPTRLNAPLNFERIAALEPDVIFATSFQLEPDVFALLEAIAPTIGPPTRDVIPTWQEVQRIFGEALDRVDEAEQVIAETEARFTAVQAEHPEFIDATFSLPAFVPGTISSAATNSLRYQFVKELGLVVSDDIASMSDSTFEGFIVSVERIDLLEADVVIWNTDRPDELAQLPGRETGLSAAAERREVILDAFLAAAIVQTNPLSIAYAIDRMVPELTAALDGDPETVPSSALRLYDGQLSPEQQAAMDAWQIALDPNVPIEDKRPHVEDFDALVPAFEAAIAVAEGFGGVSIESKQAIIADGVATVTFDGIIGESPVPGQTGTLDDVDGIWVARRADLCIYLGLLGTPCPP